MANLDGLTTQDTGMRETFREVFNGQIQKNIRPVKSVERKPMTEIGNSVRIWQGMENHL